MRATGRQDRAARAARPHQRYLRVTGDSVEYDQDAFVGKATAFDTERAQEPTKQCRGLTGALICMEFHVELPVRECGRHLVCDPHSQGRLADARGSGHCDNWDGESVASRGEQLLDVLDEFGTPATRTSHLPGLRRHRPRGPHAAECPATVQSPLGLHNSRISAHHEQLSPERPTPGKP
jgi:hypothetical protein